MLACLAPVLCLLGHRLWDWKRMPPQHQHQCRVGLNLNNSSSNNSLLLPSLPRVRLRVKQLQLVRRTLLLAPKLRRQKQKPLLLMMMPFKFYLIKDRLLITINTQRQLLLPQETTTLLLELESPLLDLAVWLLPLANINILLTIHLLSTPSHRQSTNNFSSDSRTSSC